MSELDDWIERSIQAHGGAARWKSLRTLRVRGLTYPAAGGTLNVLAQAERRGRIAVAASTTGFLRFDAFDGRHGWYSQQVGANATSGALSPGVAKEMAYAADLDCIVTCYHRSENRVSSLGPSGGGRDRMLGIELAYANGDVDDIWLDGRSYLVRRVIRRHTIDGYLTVVESDYSDYRDVDGLKLAFVEQRNNRTLPQLSYRLVVTAYEPNVDLDDDAFSRGSAR